jgi:TonB family protein
MPLAKETRLRGHLGRGALLSIWLHAQIFVPLLILIFVYAARDEAQRAEEVDVAFRDASNEELPPDLPPVEETPPPPRATPEVPESAQRHDDKKKKPKDKAKPVKLAEKPPEETKPQPKEKPEPEVPVPPLPPMPPPPPAPKPEDRAHQKMVDLDNEKEVEPPPDAKFLAQKNNRAAVETRATETNLDKAQKGTEAESSAAPSDRADQEIGDEKAKIAELEDQKSALGRKAPDVTPHVSPELSEEETPPAPKSLLALRDAPRREHELTPETVDPSLPRTPDGTIATPSDQGARGPRTDPARLNKGKRMKLALSAKDFEYLFGADAQAERRLAQTERSKKKVGRFQQRLDRVRSSLENFIPEVKPGNQTALNTRAAPFAAFVARMHRSIHKLWGFGVLEDWDEMAGTNPYNDPNRLTTLEMVLNGDGTIDNVKVIKTSGYMPYDAAAIDVAYTAGPYPDPPREIRSKNGKIYIHWRFYRDARQCATSGVDYFILDNPPADGDTVSVPSGAERASSSPAGHTTQAGNGNNSPGASLGDGPRHLERNSGGGAHAARTLAAAGSEESSAAVEPAPSGAPPPTTFPARADNPAARLTAQAWFAAFGRGDVPAMLAAAVYPFRSNNGNAASKRSELQAMLKGLVDESPAASRAVTSVQLLTAAGLRGLLGRLPPGLDDGSGSLFAVARAAGNDVLILILTQKTDGWKVVGLARR